MGKKVCPICDQVMHSSRYCRICKRWVTPYEREVNYYLNERHAGNEPDCSYHAGSTARSTAKTYQASTYTGIPPYQPAGEVRDSIFQPGSGNQGRTVIKDAGEVRNSETSREPEKQKNPFSGLKWVFIVLIFFNFVLPVLGMLYSLILSILRQKP